MNKGHVPSSFIDQNENQICKFLFFFHTRILSQSKQNKTNVEFSKNYLRTVFSFFHSKLFPHKRKQTTKMLLFISILITLLFISISSFFLTSHLLVKSPRFSPFHRFHWCKVQSSATTLIFPSIKSML